MQMSSFDAKVRDGFKSVSCLGKRCRLVASSHGSEHESSLLIAYFHVSISTGSSRFLQSEAEAENHDVP